MPLLLQPHRDRKESLRSLAAGAGILLGMMAWLTVAMGLTAGGLPVFLAIPGGLAAMLLPRFFRLTLGVEVFVFALLLSFEAEASLDWIWTGIVLSLVGRGIATVVRMKGLAE